MASRGRRRSRVHDSESDEEDMRVLNELSNSAPSRSQHILLSDDEDGSFTPPVPHPPQPTPGAWQPVVDVLHGRGVKPRTEWLLSCLNQLAASHVGFAQMPAAKKAELCFEQFLMADFNVAGAASLPPSVHSLHATELPGPFVLQVDEITDVSNSSRDRYQEKAAGPGRMLKLSMTDGVQRVFGIEYRPIRALQVLAPVGFKISLRNSCIRRGLFVLVPEILEVLGGVVDDLESARLRAVEAVNKPHRGRRVPRGVREPSLAERATSAAWPEENGDDSRNPPAGFRNAGVALHGTTNSLRVAVTQSEQQSFISRDQIADIMNPPAEVTPAPSCGRLQTARSVPEGEIVQPNQGATSREAFCASVTYQSTRSKDFVLEVQQNYPFQQDQNSLSRRQLGRVFTTPGLAVAEKTQNEQHHGSREEHRGELRWQPGYVSVVQQSSELETVQQVGDQRQQPFDCKREGESSKQSSKMKQSTADAVERSTPPVSSENPGGPPLSPTFGKLSLRSRRCTPASISQHTSLPHQQAEMSTGDDPERPVQIMESQDSEQGTCAESGTVTDSGNIPFTYLIILEDIRKANLGLDVEARGRVKCVIAGVGKFQYKGCNEFKLLLHIEDGTLITECSIAHQVVQDIIGHAPVEVSSKLANPDTHQEMLERMIRFQKFLERFEGYMDLEFRNSSLVPVVVNIVEGVESADAKLLLRRSKLALAK